MSVALSLVTPREVQPMIGTGYQSASRLAASDITMMMDILTTNKDQVLAALRRYKQSIGHIEALLNNAPDDLRVLLEDPRQKNHKLVSQAPQPNLQEAIFTEISAGSRSPSESGK